MINKILRVLFSLPIVILLVLVVFVNVRLYYSPNITIAGTDTIDYDLLNELRGLQHAINKNADVDMQELYPEGYVFLHAVYGLTWCNFIKDTTNKLSQPYFNEGHQAVQNSWNKINSHVGRSTFTEELPLAYGAFYTGWSTYLLGKKLSLEQPTVRNENEILYFKQQCNRIDSVIHERIYPVSYYGGAWPADAVLCIAALSLHDKLFSSKYETLIKDWITRVKTKLDSRGLIPHSVSPLTGEPLEASRGSSQSLMLIFLKDIDGYFAQDQFKLFKDNFIDSKFGITGIREYALDEHGLGDVDSGPVIFQLGSAATLVGMHTLYLYGDYNTATKIRSAIEAFGFPLQTSKHKIYLFGLLPMADAFIAWGHGVSNKDGEQISFKSFHGYSMIVVLILGAMLWFLFRRKKPSSKDSLHIPW